MKRILIASAGIVALAFAATNASAQDGMGGMGGMSGMKGMSGMAGMKGMSGMDGMEGMAGMKGMAGMDGMAGDDAKKKNFKRTSEMPKEERSKVVTRFSKHKKRARTDIDIDLNIGVGVPRTVELYAVPDDIVVIVPEYRYYRYIVVGDSIVIIDPDTWLIVDVFAL